jgi:nitrate/nitrite transport system substrate-binding protein
MSYAIRVLALLCGVLVASASTGRAAEPEKDELVLGFIKLTDAAPLVIANELGFFEAEGLSVRLESQANWKVVLDRVISGELDGSHMLGGHPIGASIGIGTKAPIVTAFMMDQNGKAITVSNDVWQKMQAANPALKEPRPPHPIRASTLKPVIEELKASGQPIKFGIVFPVSGHNYALRYWLAADGISPGYYTNGDSTGTQDADALLSVTPPPQMPATMAQGTIQGYCVGEPWNQQALQKGIGVPVVLDSEIWPTNPDKVFGVTQEWAAKHPETHVRVIKALIRASQWLDASLENRKKAIALLARPEYVGADPQVLENSLTGTFEFAKGDRREIPTFGTFFKDHSSYPYYSDGVWFMTQMRRWGQIAESRPDGWYDETIRKIYLPDIWREAAQRLVADGELKASDLPTTDGYRPAQKDFLDGIPYDGRQPNAYLRSLKLGLKDVVEGGE